MTIALGRLFDTKDSPTRLLGLLRDWREDDRDDAADEWLDRRARVNLTSRWREAAIRSGLGRAVVTPLGGPAMGGIPVVEHVDPGNPATGEPGYLIVRLRPGMLVADLEDRAEELAAGLGCWGVRFTPRGGDFVRVELAAADPLARTVDYPLTAPFGHIAFGVDELGAVVSRDLDELTHVAIQGSNGSGKSACTYALLGQLARRPDVDVCGIDPTGLVLGPWGEHPRGWRVNGVGADAADRYATVLRALVDDMDARIAHLPPRCDRLPITRATPLRVIVLEELAGISRLTGYRTSGQASEVQRLIARLASEGRKAGYRLVVISQRLGSDVLQTDVRDQLLTRLSFGCRDLATLRMLSPDATPEDLAPLALSPAGVALADMPGEPMRRVRAPWVGGYGAYCDLITTARSL